MAKEEYLVLNLTSEDLMVGDWVKYNPNVFNEDEYEPAKPLVNTRIEGGEDIDLAIEECYSAIPIDEEILGKNGFNVFGLFFAYLDLDDVNYFEYYYAEHRFRKVRRKTYNDGNTETKEYEIEFQCKCKYVHELQHAFRMCNYYKEFVV